MADPVVEYIGVTQAALKKASVERKARKQAEDRAIAAIPAAVQSLCDRGLVPERHRDKAAKALETHEGALGIVAMLAEKTVLRKSAEAAAAAPEPIGVVVPASTAKEAGAKGPVVSEAKRAFTDKMLQLRQY